MPSTITTATGADLVKELVGITKAGQTYTCTLGPTGDNKNIYTVLLSKMSTPSMSSEAILSQFQTMEDSKVVEVLNTYGFESLTSATPSSNGISAIVAEFNSRIQFTYCAYKELYRKALKEFFEDITTNNAITKERATVLNRKLSVILAGLNRIRIYLQSRADMITNSVADLSTGTTAQSLQQQLKDLESKEADRELYTRMMEYTEEKNNRHRNLLAMYSVLNLVAVGLIFYIAKN
jgi:hypothetical protein